MAFSSNVDSNDYLGKGIVAGTWTADSVTDGNITTGFSQISHASFSNRISGAQSSNISGGTVNITCTSGDAGTFLIYGS